MVTLCFLHLLFNYNFMTFEELICLNFNGQGNKNTMLKNRNRKLALICYLTSWYIQSLTKSFNPFIPFIYATYFHICLQKLNLQIANSKDEFAVCNMYVSACCVCIYVRVYV